MEVTVKDYLPRARKNDLIVQALDQELVVYDATNNQANLLNQTAALVWKHCDGKTSISALAAQVERELGTKVDEALIWYSLDQLFKKRLLVQAASLPVPVQGIKRRDFLKAGLVSAAVVLPVIVSLTAPQVTDAQSGTCVPKDGPCLLDNPGVCCSQACLSLSGGLEGKCV